MSFKDFRSLMLDHINGMLAAASKLYVVDVNKDELWETYLNTFKPEYNKLYIKRSEHDCSACRHFIKSFGNIVTINSKNEIVTIWDFDAQSEEYQPSIDACAKFIRKHSISDVLVTKETKFGIESNKSMLENGDVVTFDHLYYVLPLARVYSGRETVDTMMAKYRDARNVLKRSLDEITDDSVETVLDLIAQNSLYKGEEWKGLLEKFLSVKKEYAKIAENKKGNYCWLASDKHGEVLSKIRNHSIGVLLQNISAGMELDKAIRKYEAIVAPTNYKRPKAIFTKKMVEEAQKTINELGLMDALGRRFAVLDDITVNNIIFANRDASKRIAGSVFDKLKEEKFDKKSLKKLEKISIGDFIKNVVPTASSIELLLEGRHEGNLVSLIAPKNKESKTMFKWNNNFGWAYHKNLTDSMKENVKAAGGKVDGVLRFSIQWNDKNDNRDDLDAHCVEPDKNEIYFLSKCSRLTGGELDVDIIHPTGVAVENIIYPSLSKMIDGTYRFYVHCFSSRGAKSGFKAEIEFDGQVYQFEYDKPLDYKEKIDVAKVLYRKGVGFEIVESLNGTTSSKKVWNIDTNKFHPVQVMMFSPNYWDEQNGIGNKHFFFMLKNCINDTNPNGFFNEFLKEEFMKHKRVFEALGKEMRVEESNDQLSGIGFNSTQRNSVVVKVSGTFNRMLEITF